jgi:cystathionine gamma-lyase
MLNTLNSKLHLFLPISGFSTKAIHCGNEPDPVWGGVAPAINLSSTFAQPAPGVPLCFDYARCGNPTRLALERNLASLENAKYAFALNCGMAATVSIMQLLHHGEHVLCIDDVYGGTQRYLRKILSER